MKSTISGQSPMNETKGILELCDDLGEALSRYEKTEKELEASKPLWDEWRDKVLSSPNKGLTHA